MTVRKTGAEHIKSLQDNGALDSLIRCYPNQRPRQPA